MYTDFIAVLDANYVSESFVYDVISSAGRFSGLCDYSIRQVSALF